ncbi:HAMP domain-containing protein, partial [Vibrio makurazakiensis]|uniref:HAMP domain-containing protein n=1 Tax=Vibrio makurazakiensis TaxID=2910250 RepID=UPI003D0C4964
MKLLPKLLILVSLLTIITMSIIGYGIYAIAKKSIDIIVDQQLNGTLELVESIIEENNEKLVSIANITSKNRLLSKALDRGINLGVSQTLNDTASSYTNINYLLVVDYDGTVFSTSTTTSSGAKFSGELLLSSNLNDHPLFSQQLQDKVFVSEPNIDPFKSDSGESNLSQWISAPITRHGKLSGWLIISTQWGESYQALLSNSIERLVKASYPVIGIKVYPTGKRHLAIEERPNNYNTDVISRSQSLPVGFGGIDLELQFDKLKTYQNLNSMIISVIYLICVGSILLALMLFIALRQQLINPITKLVSGIQGIESDHLTKRIEVNRHDELGKIATSINEMMTNLSNSMISASLLDKEVKEKEQLMRSVTESKSRLSAILDTAADGIITIDIKGKILS